VPKKKKFIAWGLQAVGEEEGMEGKGRPRKLEKKKKNVHQKEGEKLVLQTLCGLAPPKKNPTFRLAGDALKGRTKKGQKKRGGDAMNMQGSNQEGRA